MSIENSPVLKEKEFQMWGQAILRLIRNKRNGARIIDFEGDLKNLKDCMKRAGVAAGRTNKDIKDTIKVVCLEV